MSNSNLPAMAKRKVIFFDTATQKPQTVMSSALSWGILKKELIALGVSTSNCKFVIGQTKHTCEHDEAMLPTGDFNLFRYPVTTKSGAVKKAPVTKTELLDQVKAALAENNDVAKPIFTGYSKASVETLTKMLADYKKAATKAAKKPLVNTKPAAKAKVEKAAPKSTAKKETALVKAKAVKPVIAGWITQVQDIIKTCPEDVAYELQSVIDRKGSNNVVEDLDALIAMSRTTKA